MEWKEYCLGDCITTLQRGFDITKAEQQAGNVPIISSSGITSYHNKSKAQGTGVVTGRKGTLGKVFFSKGRYWPNDTTLWIKDFKGNCPKFVFYFLGLMRLESYDVGMKLKLRRREIKMNLLNLLKEKRAAILATAKRHGARNVRIFGSVARGDFDEKSDLDFLVEMEPGRSLLDHASLLLDLEKLLGCKVDVVSEKGIKARIRDRVLREAQPL